jgi:hypothetical protein
MSVPNQMLPPVTNNLHRVKPIISLLGYVDVSNCLSRASVESNIQARSAPYHIVNVKTGKVLRR